MGILMRYFAVLASFLAVLIGGGVAYAEEQVLRIYLDADRSRLVASAKSIEMGVKTAFSEVDNVIQGRKIEFIALDHRGNSTRSKLNMNKAFADPLGLLVMAGLHSPPLIKNRAYINENKMLTLVSWAAGGPITRYPSSDNWVFRLSVDDTKAGYRIAHHAIEKGECSQPALLLEQTPWGKSNKGTMTQAVQTSLKIEPSVTWFNWGISIESARIKLRAIAEAGANCVLFVGNANDGETFSEALLSMEEDKRLPIYSHWGISGGDFPEKISADMREGLDLTFIQSCFSFVSSEQTPFSAGVFARAQELYPQLKTPNDLKAPPGFIHAYDLGRILIQALSQVELTNDMVQNRARLKVALENLEAPVQGLVKEYDKPFSVFDNNKIDAHEALGLDDLCMAHYGADDQIIVLPK